MVKWLQLIFCIFKSQTDKSKSYTVFNCVGKMYLKKALNLLTYTYTHFTFSEYLDGQNMYWGSILVIILVGKPPK